MCISITLGADHKVKTLQVVLVKDRTKVKLVIKYLKNAKIGYQNEIKGLLPKF